MIVTKVIKRTKDGFMVACKAGAENKSIVLHGNIPLLYSGMSVGINSDNGKILDYDIYKTSRNISILNKHLEDINSADDFFDKVSLHQTLETVLWRELDKTYSSLPFEKADRIAKSKGKTATNKERIHCIHNNVLKHIRSNDISFLELSKYIDEFRKIEEKGCFGKLEMNELLDLFSSEKMFGLNTKGIYDKELAEAENYIRFTMNKRQNSYEPLVSKKNIELFLENNHFLSDDQKECINCLSTTKPDFITGGAGTGKTTTIKAIIDCFSKQYEIGGLGLFAPTGRASERMNEVIGITAKTIHSALRKTPDSEFVFYNENNPLPLNLIIVDESSMVDSLLMADLLHATSIGCKIIFVGDCNQLPPVSCGKPFMNFLMNGNFYNLKVNHRQGEGNIVYINAYHLLDNEQLEEDANFVIKHIKEKEITKYCDKNIQNITPYNAVNDIINQHLRVNQLGEYAVGDKVLATKNTREYCNGDIFEIIRIDTKVYTLKKVSGNEECIFIKDMDDFILAYAITIHKMQGSECEEIKLFLPEDSKFVTKNMLYTAITRAKKRVELYYYS